ncbi:GAF domain-containing protein [Micromonosporaceae bacterium Da 78-11]
MTIAKELLFARLGEPTRMRRIAAYDLFHPELPERLDAVASTSAHCLSAPVSLVSVVLDSSQFILGSYGLSSWVAETRGLPAEWALCSRTVLSGSPYCVADSTADPEHVDNPILAMTGMRSYAGVPLRDESGIVLGAHCVVDTAVRTFTDDDLELLEEGARQVMLVLARHRTDGP